MLGFGPLRSEIRLRQVPYNLLKISTFSLYKL